MVDLIFNPELWATAILGFHFQSDILAGQDITAQIDVPKAARPDVAHKFKPTCRVGRAIHLIFPDFRGPIFWAILAGGFGILIVGRVAGGGRVSGHDQFLFSEAKKDIENFHETHWPEILILDLC